MKHILTFIIALLVSSVNGHAQNMNDVFHYNREEINGTGRYMSTSGSITGVGSDLSGVMDNPAGAAYFVSNRFMWSPGGFSNQNTAVYNNQATFHSTNSILYKPFYTNAWGLVFPFVSGTNKWNKVVLGITGRSDFHYLNHIHMKGQSASMQSIADYFVAEAQGVPTGDLNIYSGESLSGVYQWLGENYGSYAQHALLAYQGYVIDPVTPDSLNTDYVSNASFNAPLYHELKQATAGKIFSNDVFISGQYQKKLSLGFSLSFRNMEYHELRRFSESGYTPNSILQFVQFNTTLRTESEGIQIKMGMIYEPVQNVKLSLAYHSPTWWEVNETTEENLYSEALDVDDLDNDGNTTEINTFDLNPSAKNVYGAYRYVSPGKWILGMAYTFPKTGFIGLQYIYKNWQATRFADMNDDQASQDYYDYLNDLVQQTFTAEHQIRLGGELKLDDWFLRGGFFASSSPFRNQPDYTKQGYSAGIGYDFGNVELDLAMLHSKQKYAEQFFPVGLTESYGINNLKNLYTFTVRYNF